ncbi:MAG: UbiD family decarboxylase [Dehalococcoidia bacterium]|nr:UbiD family decarboxylase [Dehalococcoidia bacterium]MDZ4246351.1 UbiD family decarboxylase [Dehalococcoidia bacterium]
MKTDLRNWLNQVDKLGELRVVEGADWNLEIGAITAINAKSNNPYTLIFDKIKDYPTGFRVLTGVVNNAHKFSLVLDMPPASSNYEFINELAEKFRTAAGKLNSSEPRVVQNGPLMENVQKGSEIDLFKFPVPKWHEEDGQRYIGTGHAVITRDKDSGRVNLGCYRVAAHDKNTCGLHIAPGKHGKLDYEKYHAEGKACPVAVSVGHHPLYFVLAGSEIPHEAISEYHYASALIGNPVDVIIEEVTGLPIPADAEIVLAGWCPPDKLREEGPFGEWTGYYAGGRAPDKIIEVERVYYRNEPIILGAPPDKGISDFCFSINVMRAAMIFNELIGKGIPDVKGVWLNEVAGQQWMVVSIKQRYAGHAKQAAIQVSQSYLSGAMGRYVIVVDEDIDPTNTQEVLWAICTRSDPEKDIDIIRRCRSNALDPLIKKPASAFFNSRAIIDACKPFEWMNEFPQEIRISPELEARVKGKWSEILA